MIQRIAQGVWHGRTPSLMLFPRRGVTRTKSLGHAIRPQRPPFIVISHEPDFAEISKLMIVGNLRRRQVTVVIVNRFSGRIGVIQFARRVRLQEKVVVNEGLGHIKFKFAIFNSSNRQPPNPAPWPRRWDPMCYLEMSFIIALSEG